jgi:hypothetical protein
LTQLLKPYWYIVTQLLSSLGLHWFLLMPFFCSNKPSRLPHHI